MKTKTTAKNVLISVGVILILLALLFPLFVHPDWRENFELSILVGRRYDIDNKITFEHTVSYLRMIAITIGIALFWSVWQQAFLKHKTRALSSLLSVSASGGVGFGFFVCVLVTDFGRMGTDVEGMKVAIVFGVLCLFWLGFSISSYITHIKPNFVKKEIVNDVLLAVFCGAPAYFASGIIFEFLCNTVSFHLW